MALDDRGCDLRDVAHLHSAITHGVFSVFEAAALIEDILSETHSRIDGPSPDDLKAEIWRGLERKADLLMVQICTN